MSKSSHDEQKRSSRVVTNEISSNGNQKKNFIKWKPEKENSVSKQKGLLNKHFKREE